MPAATVGTSLYLQPVAGELLLRAGVTMLHFVENLPPYQFARDTFGGALSRQCHTNQS
jgi:hypothetical protein